MLKIQNLSKSFGSSNILKNINLEINDKETSVIIGPSGSGKSTLLRCINMLDPPTSGQIFMDNEEITNDKVPLNILRQKIGMVFQHFNLFNNLSVLNNIILVPHKIQKISYEECVEKAKKLLDKVGLKDKINSMPYQLSGGQKQRVAIARALALEPKVLLCDEATSALDPNTTKSILALLEDINEKMDITIIVVTHQMEVVKQICTRVAVMEGGKVLEIEDTEDLFLNNTEGLKALIGDEQIVLPEGVNIKIIFPKEIANEHIITNMARTLDFDFNISYGKLEKFREDVLGSVIITVKDHYANAVKRYLDERNIKWEEIKNDK